MKRTLSTLALACALALPLTARAGDDRGFSVRVLVDGMERPEYATSGAFYVEAIRGSEYTLRISNPLPYRVAVALSVDGLNTIDAKRTDARGASKWVLGPYESMVVPGWQVNGGTARRFTFTGERGSYGAWLGQTKNLGVVEAVFFRERAPIRREAVVIPPRDYRYERDRGDVEEQAASEPSYGGMGAPSAPKAEAREKSSADAAPRSSGKKLQQSQSNLSDEYAATGMGDRTSHTVESVAIDLLPEPVAQVRVRYEFRPQLVKLGILPREYPRQREPLARRERATGFADYCPEPPVRPY